MDFASAMPRIPSSGKIDKHDSTAGPLKSRIGVNRGSRLKRSVDTSKPTFTVVSSADGRSFLLILD